jgi:predicted O-methyltransferase YrrM
MQFDSIFIDASHHYADCKADIEAWLPLLRTGGSIAGHDYWAAHTGVMCAVNDVLKDKFQIVPATRIWHSSR